MKNILFSLWVSGLVFVPSGLNAQTAQGEEDYGAILQEAMRSGTYNQGQSQDWDARVKKISGDVRVKEADSEEWAALEGGMPLSSGDSIKTADGTAEVYLDDKGVITVGRNSELEFSALTKTESVFSLAFGNIAAKIQHFLDEKLKMQVRTPSAVCAVRGTEFAVEYSQLGKDTGVAVFDEGRLAVSPLDEKGEPQSEYILEKNTELSFTRAQKRFRAVQLSRMARYRTPIAGMRKRILVLRKTWKPVDGVRKAAIREKIFKRNVIRRELDNPRRGNKKGRRAVGAGKPLNSRFGRRAGTKPEQR